MNAPLTNVEDTIQELSARWQLAREAAFKEIFTQKKLENEYLGALEMLDEDKFEKLLNKLFLNSRNLGRSYQKAHGLTWERDDFSSLSVKLGSACLHGDWEEKKSSHVLSRRGCAGGKSVGRRYCQYWREAIDGFVGGISDDVGFVRSSSVSVADEKCLDIFFDEESSPTDAIWSNPYKWGSLPDEIKDDLELIQHKFGKMKVDLIFLGLSEKFLFYKLESKKNLTCGSAGSMYRSLLQKWVKEKFPLFVLKDASPVAVYGERA